MNVQDIASPAPDPLRILFVCPTARAGTPQYIHNLASHLGRRGHRVALLTSVGYELSKYATDYAVIEAIDRFRPRPLLWCRAWRQLRALRPQVIHYQGGQHPDMLLLLDNVLRIASSAQAVYTPQELQSNNRRAHHDQACKRLLGRMQHVFFNSAENREFVRQDLHLDVEHSSVVPVPDLLDFMRSDVRPEAPAVPAGRALILCFGLIEPRKGIGTLLEAFGRLRQTRPDTHLAVVGKPLMDLAPLRDCIARHGMQDHVDLVAEYVSFERMAGYFERADTVVLPYEAGWNSGVIPVALGYGKPVVATTIASAAEAVAHERTGLLIPPADPQVLCDALLRVIDDRALRERMQPFLRQAAIDQGWDPLVQTTEAVYRRVTSA
ncbi:MAG: glycosyltransferase family 4 protein [Burkholderiaceae bacterium]|nr:glycosyltransferase family 4 protein [Burkholderiaceae bacterium]